MLHVKNLKGFQALLKMKSIARNGPKRMVLKCFKKKKKNVIPHQKFHIEEFQLSGSKLAGVRVPSWKLLGGHGCNKCMVPCPNPTSCTIGVANCQNVF